MARFVAKHLVFLLLTLFVVSFLVFALNEFSPGAVARKELGAYATQEQVDVLTRQLGLDRPLPVRYAEYLGKAATGDLGYSARFKRPVKDVIGKHLGNTALLAALAFAVIVPLSAALGVAAGMRESSRLDRAILLFSTTVASVPEFALGVFLASVFVVWLGWLPGTATLVAGGGWSVATQLVLPVAVIVLFDSGYVISMIRASMIEVMQRPYIRTAVLKGMPFRDVILRHAVRNAMINPITVIMLQINYLVAGVVVVETVFAYPGFGRMMLEAALFKDIALVEPAALAHPTRSRPPWLGTDHLGRDLLSRLAWGARRVLVRAPLAVLGATALGCLLGLAAGYHRRWIDLVLTRACDIVLSFPVIILYMIILTTFGSSAWNIVGVLTLTKAPIIARIVRGMTLELRECEYVAAAKMRGESALYIMVVEILPNARGPLIVDMCLLTDYNIIIIGVLVFLGIVLPPSDPDWGGMVKDTYGMMSVWPHMALVPCAAISSLVIGFNLLAIGLREIGLRD